MAQIITKRARVSRRRFLSGATLAGAAVRIGLPPLASMFNSQGTAYAAEVVAGRAVQKPIESRFVFWFNGNGIPERYWMRRAPVKTSCFPPASLRWRLSAMIFMF